MLLPRLAALSEVCWVKKELKNLDDFLNRLPGQISRYEAAKINFAKSSYNVTIGTKLGEANNSLNIELSTELTGADIYFTLDGSIPNKNSEKYVIPFNINSTKQIKAVSYSNSKLMSKVSSKNILIHKAFGKSVSVNTTYSNKYDAGGNFGLVDGIYGSSSFTAGGWQGYEGVDFEAIVDLGEEIKINRINSSYLQRINSWIFMPKYVEYSFSNNGNNFSNLSRVENNIPATSGVVEVKNFQTEALDLTARYIKVFAKSLEKCPDWHPGAGGNAWIFVDEITVE